MEHYHSQPELTCGQNAWLIPGLPTANRGILLTHIIMAAALYGWDMSGLDDVAAASAAVASMLTTTQSHMMDLSETAT